MNQSEMIQSLRAEIAKLQRVLDLLVDQPTGADEGRRPGRPKGSGNQATSTNAEEFAPKKRTMSAEGKARIAAAQKKRWAAQKAAPPARIAPKKATSTQLTSQIVPPKSARKVAPATAKKSAGAGTRTGSTQKRAATVATRNTPTEKTVAKNTTKPATKRAAKQVTPAGSEPQTAA